MQPDLKIIETTVSQNKTRGDHVHLSFSSYDTKNNKLHDFSKKYIIFGPQTLFL